MNTSKYGLSVMGKIRVFRKDKEIKDSRTKKTFAIKDVWFNVSEKEENGGYFNKSMNLIFKRDVAIPENNQVITIVSASPIITGNGEYRKIALFVEEWNSEVETEKK